MDYTILSSVDTYIYIYIYFYIYISVLRSSRIRVRLCDPRAERVCCPVLVGRLGPGLPLLALDNATIALRSPDLAWRRAEAFFWRHEDCFPDMGETTLQT